MAYLDELRTEVEQLTKAEALAKSYTPLGQQIEALLATFPPMLLNRPWSIEELLPRLQGKYRQRPATREVAKALTQLNWRRIRCWNKTGMNRRYWIPPTVLSKGAA